MLMATMPIAVIMRRQAIAHRWADTAWSVAGVISNPGAGHDPGLGSPSSVQTLSQAESDTCYLVPGLELKLYPDEDDGYYENWAAPEPKVFVMWRTQDDFAMPVAASVSYGEGTRMLDSGEQADGVAMPPDIHEWLGSYLRTHYRPQPRRGRGHG